MRCDQICLTGNLSNKAMFTCLDYQLNMKTSQCQFEKIIRMPVWILFDLHLFEKHRIVHVQLLWYLSDAEAKLGIFQHDNKCLYYKTRLILILKNKQQNKMIEKIKLTQFGHYFFYSHTSETICMPSKKLFWNFLPFLFNSTLKWTDIWMGSYICFVF